MSSSMKINEVLINLIFEFMNSNNFQQRLLGLQDNLLNFAYMLTSDREEAKDLLQDTTLKALDNEDKYIDNVNFKGWVFTYHEKHLYQQLSKDCAQSDNSRSDRRSVPPKFTSRIRIQYS